MINRNELNNFNYRTPFAKWHIDFQLMLYLTLLISFGFFILYSASHQNINMLLRQGLRLILALFVLFLFANIPPHKYKTWAPWIYSLGLILLTAVILIGKIGKGAQQWLDFGFLRFQPSEIMKIAVPMMVAWYFHQQVSPSYYKSLIIATILILVPAILIAKQPDLGTALMVIFSGLSVIFLAGVNLELIGTSFLLIVLLSPLLWHFLHSYQKQRILTLLNPDYSPLGASYHIIQSKIAIGSGGLIGKGWLQGTQSHLRFLPEHATDFIFAVCAEEFGFIGCLVLIILIVMIVYRSLVIAKKAQNSFTRLLAASLAVTFFMSSFVNIGMVSGILPVVGIPLPLISYGGTAMVSFLANFGILMSISTHRIIFNDMES